MNVVVAPVTQSHPQSRLPLDGGAMGQANWRVASLHRCTGPAWSWWKFLLGLFGFGLLLGATAWAQAPVRIGVLAYRPQAQVQAQWQPLAQALKRAIPARDFELLAYDLKGLELAVAQRQVDLVLTNPGHYVLLTRRFDLQAPLATLVNDVQGQEVAAFGGVIFTRATELSIQSLADVKGRSVIAASSDSLGSYQVQAYELLKADIDVQQQTHLSFTGMPQDKVVEAVLRGQADVGFVRTGLLEEMAREGKLNLQALRVLNPQKFPGFPLQISTALYPEWPLSYLPHVDQDLVRHVSAALYLMHEDTELMHQLGIRGFSVPVDYRLVVDTLRELRMPPFDKLPLFTLRDVLRQYYWQVLGAGVALLAILLLSLRLGLITRRLRAERNMVLTQQVSLRESELRWKLAVQASGGGMWDWDLVARKLYVSDQWKANLGYTAAEVMDSPDEWEQRLHPQDRAVALAALDACVTGRSDLYLRENRTRCKDGSYKWIQERGQVVSRDAAGQALRMIGLDNDITEHKNAQQQLQLAASVFQHAREGIIIADAEGAILDVNQAFSDITGYSKTEVLGENVLTLNAQSSDRHLFETATAALQTKDHWVGETCKLRKNGETYTEMLTLSAVRNPQGQLTLYLAMFFDITATKAHQAQLEHLAHFDALTNLPNRVLLADRLKQAMAQSQRHGSLLAVAYLDLDGFKVVNDQHGHDVGDQLLIEVANTMRHTLRGGDTLARIGGDEFVAVLADLHSTQDCDHTLQRLLTAAAQEVHLGDLRLQVSASLGVTFYPQDEAVDADQLMRQADQAMYQAKLAGKNRFHVFDAVHDHSVRGQHLRIEAITQGLDAQQFELFYQPKVNLRTGQLVGLEALLRWRHPEQGLLLPGQFLPVIEDHAFSVVLGDWVINEALRQMAQWRAQGAELAVSVNVGARQLQCEDFVAKLRASLARYPGLSPSQLTMEVLETSALADLGRAAKVIDACAAIGVQFALDDFGTGYSSLTYLKHLPVTLIKIDRGFVSGMLDDPDDLAIMEGVLGLAHAFKREVIAEGMESAAQGQRLLDLGCDLAQGYGIARPMPASAVLDWSVAWRRAPTWQDQHAQTTATF